MYPKVVLQLGLCAKNKDVPSITNFSLISLIRMLSEQLTMAVAFVEKDALFGITHILLPRVSNDDVRKFRPLISFITFESSLYLRKYNKIFCLLSSL